MNEFAIVPSIEGVYSYVTQSMIVVDRLSKTYRVPEREAGLGAALRSLVRRRVREVPAVAGVSLGWRRGRWWGSSGPTVPARPPPSRCWPG